MVLYWTYKCLEAGHLLAMALYRPVGACHGGLYRAEHPSNKGAAPGSQRIRAFGIHDVGRAQRCRLEDSKLHVWVLRFAGRGLVVSTAGKGTEVAPVHPAKGGPFPSNAKQLPKGRLHP